MSRVWRWRARGALVRRAARAGADLARRRVGWSGREAARTTATRSTTEPRSSNSPLGSGRGVRHRARGRRQPLQERFAGARSAGSGVRRKPTPSSRLASGSAQARGRAHDGGEVGGGAATRRLALGLGTRKASRCARAWTAGTEADCGREGRSLRRTAKSRRRARRCRVVGVDARQRVRRRQGRRRSRDFVDSHLGSGLKRVTVREDEDSYHRGSARARGAIGRAYGGSRRRAHR